MTQNKSEKFISQIWSEQAEEDDPFTSAKSLCGGYDVYGDLLGKINWIDYLYLLFRQNPPSKDVSTRLNNLAVAIACQGPRDLATQAATSAAAGGSTLASCLMASLAVGAGQYGGAKEVFHGIELWEEFSTDLSAWKNFLEQSWPQKTDSDWLECEHPFGFDPNGVSCATPVRQTLEILADGEKTPHLSWLLQNREQLEAYAGMPLTFSGLASCAFFELGFGPQEGEMLYLLLRLPGAAALALEQHWLGWQSYPFHKEGLKLIKDPGPLVNQEG